MKNKAFTLIELLAVIIILGVLMIIAIPSVTEYIQSSRKNAYITTATQYISGARNKINSGEIAMYDTEATYYLPASCITLEKGGNSPFGEWIDAYVVVTYDGFGYDYYWTSRDSSNMGILLTDEKLLDESRVQAGITSISTEVGIGDREKILIINNCDGNDLTEQETIDSIPKDGILEENVKSSEPLTEELEEGAVLDSIASRYVASETGIDFSVAPSDTNGKGIYIRTGTENDIHPIYYYRGNVTNNNVIFAGFCWKILRTTETGGIKIVYSGIPSEGKCVSTRTPDTRIGSSNYNTKNDDNAYLGYMYGTPGVNTYEETHKSTKTSTSSTIKTYVDEWYKTNIDEKGYTKKIEDTVWCNDRSFSTTNTGTGAGKSVTYYAARDRLATGTGAEIQPSFECKNLNDRFTVNTSNGNGALTYPVALITADEATLAGIVWGGSTTESYLYDGQVWWTMTPDNFSNNGQTRLNFGVGSVGNIGTYWVNSGRGVRPAISLKPGTKFVEGTDGTPNNPYVVK